MTKTICDICGKDISATRTPKELIMDMNFCISSYGKIWDICPECREDFNRWMVIRKSEAIKEVSK